MTSTEPNDNFQPPTLKRDAAGRVEPQSLAGVIEWFLAYDRRVAVIKFPAVEALFQGRQEEARRLDPDAFVFARAEDRLAVGIMQAVSEHTSESALGDWIRELLGALDDAAKTNEAISGAYNLHPGEDAGVLAEAEKIPSHSERTIYLTSCWLETLCTAEARVLGWIYQQLYGRPFTAADG